MILRGVPRLLQANPPKTLAGRLEVANNLRFPRWIDEEGVEHEGEPMIDDEGYWAILKGVYP